MIDQYKIEQAAAGYAGHPEERGNKADCFADGVRWALYQIMSREHETVASLLQYRLESDPLGERLTVDTQTRAFWPEWIQVSMALSNAIIAADRDGDEDECQAAVKAHITALTDFLKEKAK